MPVVTEEPRTQTQTSGGGGARRPPGTRNALGEAMPPAEPTQPASASSALAPIGGFVVLGWVAFQVIKWLGQVFAG